MSKKPDRQSLSVIIHRYAILFRRAYAIVLSSFQVLCGKQCSSALLTPGRVICTNSPVLFTRRLVANFFSPFTSAGKLARWRGVRLLGSGRQRRAAVKNKQAVDGLEN